MHENRFAFYFLKSFVMLFSIATILLQPLVVKCKGFNSIIVNSGSVDNITNIKALIDFLVKKGSTNKYIH